ncbi:flagellar basal body rod protein [Bacillus tianshenii]|nr:flagellar basal body rod protein [Bacillus tianshenii]
MKKLGLLVVGGIAAFTLIANLDSLVGLAISLVIMYYALKGFLKAESLFKKVLWAVFGLIALAVSAANVPAIIGIVAAYVLYLVVKKWKTKKEVVVEEDPFINFEKQWAELNKNY